MNIRRAEERGVANFGWLNSNHTFSFGHYYDPRFMGFGPLRVINDDRVAPGGGFPTHGHSDMEIISYVVEGGLEHKDSIGKGSVIVPGEVQRMTAGTGIRHSEYNASGTDPVRFLQIWIQPEQPGLKPGYEQKSFYTNAGETGFKLVGSPDGREGSVTIHQDVLLFAGRLAADGELPQQEYTLEEGRIAWVQVVKGELTLNGNQLKEGDGVGIEAAGTLQLSTLNNAEVLVFDMWGKQRHH